jgi:hypothetical protein
MEHCNLPSFSVIGCLRPANIVPFRGNKRSHLIQSFNDTGKANILIL